MKLDTFFDNFGLLADAPNGVQKLREIILQLAVQGKLVPQDPKDEPASVLIKKIKSKKEKLIKDKTIKPLKKLHRKAPEKPPYDLPDNWKWVRFNEVIWCFRGHNPPKSEFINSPEEGYVRFVQITDFKTDSKAVYVPDSPKLKRVYKGEIIMAAYRHIGKLSRDMEGAFNVALCKVNEIEPMNRDYVEKIIGTDLVKGELLRASGRGHIPSMHSDHLLSLFIPIPPLAEQKRIVAKVDELMALCDELEARKQQVNINCIQLNDASVHKLLTAHEPKKFGKHWQRICDNFDLLYSKPENVNKLRQAILQLAVQGKLVQQDPKDEPASVLLEKIKAEKERLIKNKEIKKGKPLPPINPEEIPFKVPQGWCWVRLNEIFKFIDYRGKTPQKISSGVRLITAKNIRQGSISLEPEEFISEDTYEEWMTRGIPCYGDILFTTEAPLANVARVTLKEKFGLAQRAINFQPYLLFDTCFLQFALMSEVIQRLIKSKATGMTAKGIKAARLKLISVPFPPLSEQNRIVAKIDELMALCDELEASLSKSQTDCDRLMEAAVGEILAA